MCNLNRRIFHGRIFQSSRERNAGNAWMGLGSLVRTSCHFSYIHRRADMMPYSKYWFPSTIRLMFLMFIFFTLSILWFGLFNLLFALCLFYFKGQNSLWHESSSLSRSIFVFSLDHYNPFFDSSSSLVSDVDTAAQIETFITGTVVDNCLTARLLTQELWIE